MGGGSRTSRESRIGRIGSYGTDHARAGPRVGCRGDIASCTDGWMVDYGMVLQCIFIYLDRLEEVVYTLYVHDTKVTEA